MAIPDPHSTTWQRFKDAAELSSKIATVVLTGVAFYATFTYNRQEDRTRETREREQASLQQLQTIIGLFGPLSSQDPKTHNLAVLTVKELTANVPLALKLCLAVASQAECATTASTFAIDTLLRLSRDSSPQGVPLQQTALAALDVRQSTPDTGRGRPDPTATATPGSQPARDSTTGSSVPAREGWVFLGTYTDSAWRTRYLDFPPGSAPSALAGKTLRVRKETGALNVRANLFYQPGYDRILDVLTPGSTLTLVEVSSYADGGYYIWARVSYRRARS